MDIYTAYDLLKTLAIFFASLMLVKYVFYLLLAPIHPVMEKLRKLRFQKDDYRPLVSVIVPAWNEEVGILKTIKSLLGNSYENLEVIVVNDGSTDNTDKVVREFADYIKSRKLYNNKRLVYIAKENGGKGTALNEGLRNAKGEINVTVDADSVLLMNAISNLVKYYQDPGIYGVVGNVVVETHGNILNLIQKIEYLFGFYFKRAHAVLGAEYIFGGACSSFRREVFEQLGGFDTSNKTEDIEMSIRMRAFGFRCTFAEDVICRTEGASSFLGLVNQRLRWKKGRFDTFLKYRKLFFSKDRKHNKWLTFFVLPYALFSELQLLVEPLAISLLLGYSVISGDYLSMAIGIMFISLVYVVNALFSWKKINLITLLIFPFTWVWFYFLVVVEYAALIKSLKMVFSGDDIVWQKWQRKGVSLS